MALSKSSGTPKSVKETKAPRDIKSPVVPKKKAPVASAEETKSPGQKRKGDKQKHAATPAKKQKLEHVAYINRLSKGTTEESLKKALSPFGKVIDVDIIRSRRHIFAFVSFESSAGLEKAVAKSNIKVNNKSVYINKKMVREQHQIAVTKVPKGTTEAMVKLAFKQFGEVSKCKTLRSGFVVGFASAAAKESVLSADEIEVNGAAVTVEDDQFDPTAVKHVHKTKKERADEKAAKKEAQAALAAAEADDSDDEDMEAEDDQEDSDDDEDVEEAESADDDSSDDDEADDSDDDEE